MIAWLLAVLVTISSPATTTQPAVRLAPPPPFALVDAWSAGCTYTLVDGVTVGAGHCTNGGWRLDGDIATRDGVVEWADPSLIAPGSMLWAVGFPAGKRVEFILTALTARVVTVSGKAQLVLMAKGSGPACSPGASGMVAWSAYGPIGPMSVYSTDPAVTGLPAGEFVCGFAI